MAYPQDSSALHKTLLACIQPSDRLHITIDLQQELADRPWLPGMSVFSINGPPYGVAQSSAQGDELLPGSPVPTSLPLHHCHNYSSPCTPVMTDLGPQPPSLLSHQPKPQITFAHLPPDQQQAFMRQKQLQHRLLEHQQQQNIAGMVQPQGEHNTTQQHSSNPSSNHVCSEASDIDLDRDAHVENSRASTSKSQTRVSPATVLDRMRESGASEDTIRTAYSNPALLGYNYQLMLLERQNLKRLAMATTTSAPVSGDSRRRGPLRPLYHGGCSQQDYISQLKLLDQQQKKRLALAREERDDISKTCLTPNINEQRIKRETDYEAARVYAEGNLHYSATKGMNETKEKLPAHIPLPLLSALQRPVVQETQTCVRGNSPLSPDDQNQRSQVGPSHQLWLSGPHALQDYETQRRLIDQHKNPQNRAPANLALQDYQMQLMLLEQQNKKRKILQDAEKAKADEQLAAQRQAIIQRHQVNMTHWQQQAARVPTLEMHAHTPKNPPFPPQSTQKPRHAVQDLRLEWQAPVGLQSHQALPTDADQTSSTLHQRSAATRDLYNYIGQPKNSGVSGERFFMDLAIRPSKKAVEQAELDPDMNEWSEVERPRKRACSEESEQFFEGSDLIDLGSE